MKKSVLFIVAVLSILVSCSKESSSVQNDTITPEETTVQEPTEEMCYLTAVFEKEQPSSKANIADNGDFSWSNGDAIAVFNSTDNKYYLFVTDAENGATSAKFSRVAVPGSNWALAYYPASVVMSSEEISAGVSSARDNSTTVTLPASYSSIAVAERSFAMKATVSGSSLYFQHLGALMRFKFKNVPYQATKMVLEMNSGISGTYTVSGNPAEITATGTGTTTVIFDEGTASTISVPIPTATYSSFSVTFKDSGDHVLFAKSATGLAFVVSRANIYASASAVNAQGEEFYLLSEAYGWNASEKIMRFIKIGDNTYRIAAWTKQHNGKPRSDGAGYKIAFGYAYGTGDAFWNYTFGSVETDSKYTGTLKIGSSAANCHAGYDSEARVQSYTINVSENTWTTVDNGAGGSFNYPAVDLIIESSNYSMTGCGAAHNWKITNHAISAGGHTYHISQHDKTYSDKTWESKQDGKNITNATPYATLNTTGQADGSLNLAAGNYDIYYNDVTKDIWFVPTGE